MPERTLVSPAETERGSRRRLVPLLSVIVPVYNQVGSIGANLRTIFEQIEGGLGEPFEIVVVSDGSIDRTEERLLENRSESIRVIHYDRNLGKGYAIKVGALAARGRWISYVDADLDLDPASIPAYLRAAEAESLDFVVGSKRHPDSVVSYPPSRRVGSWLYQQLIRAVFRLNVRDTQVGLKVFRREIAEQVLPLLLVKRYAFDLELLAVSRALGFGRVREMPVRLSYRFTGSGVRSLAVLRALVDTAAVAYRLRVLRYYQRKRSIVGSERWGEALDYRPLVSILTPDPSVADRLDYARVEAIALDGADGSRAVDAAQTATGEVLAFLGVDAVPASNWLSSTLPFLARDEIAAIVTPTMAPAGGTRRQCGAACICESRFGGGSLYFRFTPGNLRFVKDFPATNIVVRRSDFLAASKTAEANEDLCGALNALGKRVLYTPETVVVARTASLFRPHLRRVAAYARARAQQTRRRGLAALRFTTLVPLALLGVLVAGVPAAIVGGAPLAAWAVAVVAYLAALVGAGLVGALRFRRWDVLPVVVAGLLLTHLVYGIAFVRHLLRRPAASG